MQRPRFLAALTGLVMVAAACGIPTTKTATTIPPHRVPYHLLSPTIPTSTTTTQPALAYVSEPIYLVDPVGKAKSFPRDIPVPATLDAVIEALLAGPTTSESSTGVISAIPPTVRILSSSVSGGTATLNLSASFGQISSTAETQAVTQLVLTTTKQPGIVSVLFEIEGRAISVPTASGVSVSRPVTQADYSSLTAP